MATWVNRVQEGAENAPLWGPSVEDQRSGDVVSYLDHLGAVHQKVQDPVAQGGVETQGLKLNDELGGYHLIVYTTVEFYYGIYSIVKCKYYSILQSIPQYIL